jgi:hypothetical protein
MGIEILEPLFFKRDGTTETGNVNQAESRFRIGDFVQIVNETPMVLKRKDQRLTYMGETTACRLLVQPHHYVPQ